MPAAGETRFREEQRLRQWWLWLLVGALAFVAWWAFVSQILLGRPFGDRPASDTVLCIVWLAIGIGAPALLWSCRLVVEVDEAALRLCYFPFLRRTFPLPGIARCEAVTYRPLVHYGGWGIRWSPGRGWAYTTHGNRGVKIDLARGKTFLLGSQRPDDLARAVAAARRG